GTDSCREPERSRTGGGWCRSWHPRVRQRYGIRCVARFATHRLEQEVEPNEPAATGERAQRSARPAATGPRGTATPAATWSGARSGTAAPAAPAARADPAT